jgi:hypothetical protein
MIVQKDKVIGKRGWDDRENREKETGFRKE